jgi:hypothetical protein
MIIVDSKNINLTLGSNDSPEIFTAETIDNFFKSLPLAIDFNDTIYLINCIGKETCNKSIAINKGYNVL